MSKDGLGELERLTDSETLLIDRRRNGWGQLKAAKVLGVSHSWYGKMERGVVEVERMNVLPLTPHERCLLYRHRAGKTQAAVAEELKCCRYWVNQMERGDAPSDTLLWYWEQ